MNEPVTCPVADLVRLDHVTMPDKTKVTISPAATLRCATAEGFAHFIRDDSPLLRLISLRRWHPCQE